MNDLNRLFSKKNQIILKELAGKNVTVTLHVGAIKAGRCNQTSNLN